MVRHLAALLLLTVSASAMSFLTYETTRSWAKAIKEVLSLSQETRNEVALWFGGYRRISVAGRTTAGAVVDAGVFFPVFNQDRVCIALRGDDAGLIAHRSKRGSNRLEGPFQCDHIG